MTCYSPTPIKPTTSVSHSSEHNDTEYAKFIHTDVEEFLGDLKQQHGKDSWLIGSGQLNTLLLNHNFIDKIILTYIPIVLGLGIPPFALGAQETKLQVSSSKSYQNGFVRVTLMQCISSVEHLLSPHFILLTFAAHLYQQQILALPIIYFE